MREDEGVTRHISQLGKNSTEYKFDKFETFSEVKIAHSYDFVLNLPV